MEDNIKTLRFGDRSNPTGWLPRVLLLRAQAAAGGRLNLTSASTGLRHTLAPKGATNVALSTRQKAALRCLGPESRTPIAVAQALNTTVPAAYRILDALIRRNLVVVTPMGRYAATSRGRNKVAA